MSKQAGASGGPKRKNQPSSGGPLISPDALLLDHTSMLQGVAAIQEMYGRQIRQNGGKNWTECYSNNYLVLLYHGVVLCSVLKVSHMIYAAMQAWRL